MQCVPAPFVCDLLRFDLSFSRLLAICFVSVLSFRHAFFPFTQAGSFNPLLKPSLLDTLASRREGVGR